MPRGLTATRACGVCGAEFAPKSPRQKYCSTQCNSAADRARKASAMAAAKKGRKCLICGRPLDGKQLKYCSRECAWKGSKTWQSKLNRKYDCGKPRKQVLMYADIRKRNRDNPIQSGWRGRPCMGGRAASCATVKAVFR